MNYKSGLPAASSDKLQNYLHLRVPKTIKQKTLLDFELEGLVKSIDFLDNISEDLPNGLHEPLCHYLFSYFSLVPDGFLHPGGLTIPSHSTETYSTRCLVPPVRTWSGPRNPHERSLARLRRLSHIWHKQARICLLWHWREKQRPCLYAVMPFHSIRPPTTIALITWKSNVIIS